MLEECKPTARPIILDNGNMIYYKMLYSLQQSCTNTIIAAHGNGFCLKDMDESMQMIIEQVSRSNVSCNVVAFDWEGYGASDGHASEEAMHRAIDAVYHLDELRGHKIIPFGFSIGSTAASYLGALYQLPTVIMAGISDGRKV